ncbi:MFS transporter [Arthrobacter oryzae]|uniref:MFS transporter n=2 Tax=Arthrobacter oryzae TaxID=409290 RepID=A0A3N0C1U0_9MICC|nr:MFS transporter [Arthrobacter oryzae]
MHSKSPSLAPERERILHRGYRLVTLGSCALVFMAAFESLAVTTIMPLVSRELDGAGLYALAFAGPFATGVMGMVAAGNWSDRRGPAAPLMTSVAVFALGLLIAGTAGNMSVLVAGRLVQGLGGGALTVALYVVVARVYPALLHPKIFAAFAAAWVIPSLVGPLAAGIVAQWIGWQWVFLGVVGLVVPALLMVVPALRGLNGGPGSTPPEQAAEPGAESAAEPGADPERRPEAEPGADPQRRPEAEPGADPDAGEGHGRTGRAVTAADPRPLTAWRPAWDYRRLGWATLAALAVLGLNLSAEIPAVGTALSAAAVVVALVAVRPLVPAGTLRARPGLPSVILIRGLAAAAFFGAEVYVPYLLVERYAFSATLAGLALTGGSLAWAAASAIQGRLGPRLGHRRAIRIGAALVLGAIIVVLTATIFVWPAVVAIAGWVFAGGGMGLLYPRLSVLTLALSTRATEGFNSSAMSIADSLGAALVLAVSGVVFAALAANGAAFSGVFALAAVIAAAAVVVAPRITPAK